MDHRSQEADYDPTKDMPKLDLPVGANPLTLDLSRPAWVRGPTRGQSAVQGLGDPSHRTIPFLKTVSGEVEVSEGEQRSVFIRLSILLQLRVRHNLSRLQSF